MNKIFTQNLLIRRLYGELNEREQEMLNEKLAADWQLIEDLQALGEVVKRLDGEKYSPCNTSLNIIMEHSKKTAPVAFPY